MTTSTPAATAPKAPYAKCHQCPLAKRQLCPSSIPAGASMIVIGEAPGTEEIIERTPFVGDSGKVLQGTLTYIGVDWSRVAKTNAVLCRPLPSEGTPIEAVHACADRLAYDLRCANTSTVIAAGNIAAYAMDRLAGRVSGSGIMARAGETYDYNDVIVDDAVYAGGDQRIALHNRRYKYTTVVNPAFLLRNDEYAPQYIRQLERAVNPLPRDFDINKVTYALMTPENKARIIQYLASFDRGAPMAFDVETDDLQWYDTESRSAAPLLCLVITLEDWRSVIIPVDMLRDPAVRDIVDICFNEYHIITQNGKFDQNVMSAREAMSFEINDDTMLMHYALYELGSHGLKELATEYLGAPDYERWYVDDWFNAHGIKKIDRRYSLLPPENLYKYAAIDGVVTLQLWRIFKPELIAKGLHEYPYTKVLLEVANTLPTIEQTGIGIDRDQLNSASIEFQKDLAAIEAEMTAMIAPLVAKLPDTSELKRLMRGKRKAERNTYTYNPRSNPQTSAILYDLLDLKLTKRLIKPTGTNTGKEALEALPDHDFINLLRHHRRVAKMFDTYIASIQRRVTPAGILHVDFRLTGTEIGRLSASNGDHGIPRPDDYYGAVIRSAFTADPNDDDEVLVAADYSQAELRAFAHLANVKFLIEKYAAGQDVHTETALMLEEAGALIFAGFREALTIVMHDYLRAPEVVKRAKSFIKRLRVLAKNINFGNIYQGGPAGISGMIGGAVPMAVVASVLKVYHSIMPEAADFAASQFEFLKKHGYVTTVFNRHRRFYVINDANRDEAQKAVVHMVVAGSAADLTNLSAARLVRRGVRICHMVHDSLIARARRSEAQAVAQLMSDTMIAIGQDAMPRVPWLVDIEYADEAARTFPRRWVPKPDRRLYDARGKLLAA
jgi:uracil-DNA glycosylase family 4